MNRWRDCERIVPRDETLRLLEQLRQDGKHGMPTTESRNRPEKLTAWIIPGDRPILELVSQRLRQLGPGTPQPPC